MHKSDNTEQINNLLKELDFFKARSTFCLENHISGKEFYLDNEKLELIEELKTKILDKKNNNPENLNQLYSTLNTYKINLDLIQKQMINLSMVYSKVFGEYSSLRDFVLNNQPLEPYLYNDRIRTEQNKPEKPTEIKKKKPVEKIESDKISSSNDTSQVKEKKESTVKSDQIIELENSKTLEYVHYFLANQRYIVIENTKQQQREVGDYVNLQDTNKVKQKYDDNSFENDSFNNDETDYIYCPIPYMKDVEYLSNLLRATVIVEPEVEFPLRTARMNEKSLELEQIPTDSESSDFDDSSDSYKLKSGENSTILINSKKRGQIPFNRQKVSSFEKYYTPEDKAEVDGPY